MACDAYFFWFETGLRLVSNICYMAGSCASISSFSDLFTDSTAGDGEVNCLDGLSRAVKAISIE